MATEKLPIVIFGATGFTGKYTVKEVAKFAKERNLKFGVAGRRKEALEAVVKEFAPDIENVSIIIADLKDEESLKKMAEQAKVLINCCGPYRFYGEPIVKACIEAHTHHIDVSGEPQYMETMQLKYNKAAQEAGVYIISACGVDSIPCDLGVIFIQDKFDGQVNSVESYLKFSNSGSGPVINYGTWESAVYGVAHHNELHTIRSKLYPEKLPEFWPKLKLKGLFHKSDVSEGWSVPFLGSDQSVAYRTQRFLYEEYKQRPVQIKTYATLSSLCGAMVLLLLGLVFLVLSKFESGRNLLLKYPGFFSYGIITREGPKPEALKNMKYSITFKAKGWPEKLADPTAKYTTPPNKEIVVKLDGSDAYTVTSICAVVAAIVILEESEKMPKNGGVLPPGAAFARTSYLKELNKNRLQYEIISQKDKSKSQ